MKSIFFYCIISVGPLLSADLMVVYDNNTTDCSKSFNELSLDFDPQNGGSLTFNFPVERQNLAFCKIESDLASQTGLNLLILAHLFQEKKINIKCSVEGDSIVATRVQVEFFSEETTTLFSCKD